MQKRNKNYDEKHAFPVEIRSGENMTRCPIEPDDNAGKRFEEIIERLYWIDEYEEENEEQEEED